MSSDVDAQQDRWRIFQSLPFRVVAFLSLALLPIGLLAIWQTQNLDETLKARTELSLIALTESAVSGERETLQRAIGAARGQAVTYGLTSENPALCSAAFRAFQAADPTISFAGFLPLDGHITCSSAAAPFTITPPERAALIGGARDLAFIPRIRQPAGATDEVAVLTQPVMRDDAPIGQIVLFLPIKEMSATPDRITASSPLSVNIFNGAGDIILGQGEAATSGKVALDLYDPTRNQLGPRTFVGRNADGERRIFVVVTLVPDLAYVVAGWATGEGFLASNIITLPSFFLPALMWLASLLVAYFAVHRLVVSPVQDLRVRMRRFAVDRSLQRPKGTEMLPQELFDLEQTFVNMAYDLIDDEARMENSLREKNVLLKEVHHRVKNNLQMISSIMNMQIRAAVTRESRQELRRLQDRVLGLATAHRFLYQSRELARADAGPLLHDICAPLFSELTEKNVTATHSLQVDSFSLVPDQAVPLALLAGEVGTHAVQHMPAQSDAPLFIDISLKVVSPGVAMFRCRNATSRSDDANIADKSVGWQLIRAFALQLGGTLERLIVDDVDVISVEFPITTIIPDALDY